VKTKLRDERSPTMIYRADCTKCGTEILRFERLGEPEIRVLRRHLSDAHPTMVAEPDTLPLGVLLMYIHLRLV
jgi:hypothetical protein